MQVDLCRLAAGVPEPQGDGHDVDSGLEQTHRGGVSEDVRGDPLARQRRAWAGCAGGVEVQPCRYRVAAQRATGPGREQRGGGSAGEFSCPGAEDGNGFGGHRCGPVLATLAVAEDMRAGVQGGLGSRRWCQPGSR